MTDTSLTPSDGPTLGEYLKKARKASGLTLRAVENLTGNAVTNGYLSQIEGNTIQRPSPNMLFHLANAYELDYGDLLIRAGHRVPSDADAQREPVLNGIPLRALEDLTTSERDELLSYITYLRTKRA